MLDQQQNTLGNLHVKQIKLNLKNPFFSQPTFERIIQKDYFTTSRNTQRYIASPQQSVNAALWDNENLQKYRTKGSSYDEKMKKYGLVSTKAVNYFYKTYKNIEKLSNKNIYLEMPQSAQANFIASCQKNKLNPITTGIVKHRGKSNEFNVKHQLIGDQYAIAVSKAIKQLNEIEIFKLKDNRLSDIGISSLIKNMSPKTKQIDLSKNLIGKKSL